MVRMDNADIEIEEEVVGDSEDDYEVAATKGKLLVARRRFFF